MSPSAQLPTEPPKPPRVDELAREGMSQVGGTLRAWFDTVGGAYEQSARRNREVQISPAEIALAEALRGVGLSYEQQVPFGPYDADFYFAGQKLVLEVDGKQHAARWKEDRRRDECLAKQGIETLRVTAVAVFKNPYAVAEQVWARLGRRNAELVLTGKAPAGDDEVGQLAKSIVEAGKCEECEQQAERRFKYGKFTICLRCLIRRRHAFGVSIHVPTRREATA